jgi:hypothetical protein
MTTIRYAVSIASRFILLALFAFAPRFLGAQVEEIKVESEVMPADKIHSTIAPSLKLDIHNIQITRRILLEPLAESEKSALAPGAKDWPLQIGIGRGMPAPYSDKVELSALEWFGLNDGGKAAALTVTSPGASALRLALSVAAMAEGIEIRFFNMETPEKVFGPYTAKELLRGVNNQQADPFWSPVIEGDTIGMEIFLLEGRYPDELSFSIPKISHLWMSVLKSAQKNLNDIGLSGSCNVDIACNTQGWGTDGNSVVKYIYTTPGGNTGQCTGTLLNDKDPSTYIPYFLTASHCIDTQSAASNMNTYWFFQRSMCGGAAPTSVTQQTGGATLLSNSTTADYSFMQLNDTPPPGAVWAGWSAGTISPGTSVVGIHHPMGDLKKISIGNANGYAPYGGNVDGIGNWIRVTWSSGVVEHGSSGSGIWISSGGSHYLVGILTGGNCYSCSTASQPDWYVRFNKTYGSISQWLGSTTNPIQLQNDVPETNLSGAAGSQQSYYISVPSGAQSLTVTTSGGTGDMDLYVRFGSLPTPATYDCRPYLYGNNESCTFSNSPAGDWYITLNAYTTYSGMTLTAAYITALPDLVISSGTPTITPSFVAPGGTVQLLSTWTVKNQGGGASGAFENGFYLSTNPTVTSSDTYLGSNSNSSGLAAGSWYNWGAQTLTIPAGVSPDVYYIGILTDRNNTVSESNETNNYVSVPITIIPASCDVQSGFPITNLSGVTGSQPNHCISVPSGAQSLTVTTSGGTGDMDLYVRFGSPPTTISYDCRPYQYGNNETCTFTNPSAGDWYIMLNGYTAYSGVTLTATYVASQADLAVSNLQFSPTTISIGAHPSAVSFTLTNNGPTNLASPNTRLLDEFFLSANTTFGDSDDIPIGTFNDDINLNSGSYIDLTVTANGLSYLTIPSSAGGSYYVFVKINHYSPSILSDPTMTNNYARTSGTIYVPPTGCTSSNPCLLQIGVPAINLSGAAGSQIFYRITVPTGVNALTISTTGGTGDADLYVRFGSPPTTSYYDCRPYQYGNNESCTFTNPPAGNWYIMLNGYSAYSGVTLTAGNYTGPPPVNLNLNSGGAASWSSGGINNATWVGYSRLTVNSGVNPYATAVFSFKQGGFTVTEAGVPASPPTTLARVFIDYRTDILSLPGQSGSGLIDINTGIAVVNTGTATANVTYTLRDITGSILAVGNGTIAAGTHFAKFISQLSDVAPNFTLPANFQTAIQFASLEISSDQLLSVLALRGTNNQRNDFLITTTPVADLTKPANYNPVYFPQFADGGGYTTSLVLLNTSNTTERGTLQILANNGSPLVVYQVGGTTDSSFRYTIPPGGTFHFQTDGSPLNTAVGWVRLTPDLYGQTPVGSGVFSYNPGPMLISESGIPAAVSTTHARVYVDLSGDHNTGLAIANVGTSAASITLNAFQNDGVTPAGTSQGPLQLSASGHDAKFADQFITGLPDGFTGVLDISSVTPFAALTMRSLVNERDEFLMTTFPIADANAPAPSPIVFPQVVDGGGYATQVIVISSSGAASTTLSFYDENGVP